MAGLGGRIKCAAGDLYAEQQLSDERYIRRQLDCVLGRGPCDDNGALIRSKLGLAWDCCGNYHCPRAGILENITALGPVYWKISPP